MPDLPDDLYSRTLRALQDTTLCPACTATMRAGRCAACGLDVSGPVGLLVWQDSQAVVRALMARQHRVASVRATQLRRAVPPTPVAAAAAGAPVPTAPPLAARPGGAATVAAAGPVATTAGPRPAQPVAPPPAAAAPPAPAGRAPRPPAPVPPAQPRRPWRVQTVLQVVGACLLVAASITFLVFAWDVMGLRGRAAVVAGGTLVVFTLASWLRARRLTQGAEAVGAVAVVLLLLDAWALRATDVLVVGGATSQAGVSLLACAGLLTVWGTRSRLQVGSVAGAVLLPLAPLMWLPVVTHVREVAGLLLLAGALTALRAVPPWASARAARVVLRVLGATALPVVVLLALGAAVRDPGAAWLDVLVLGVTVGVLALQVAAEASVAAGQDAARARAAWARGAGAVAALTGAVAGATLAAPAGGLVASQAAVVGACLVAGAVLGARQADVCLARPAALVVAGVAGGGAASAVVLCTAALLVSASPDQPFAAPLVALAVAAALGALVARTGTGRAAVVAAGAARTAVVLTAVAVPVVAARGPVPELVLVLGEALVVAAFVVAERFAPLGATAARTGAVAAAVLAVLGAAPAPAWTAAALLVPAALALRARTWSPSPRAAAASTLTAGALVLAAAAVAGPALNMPGATTLALAVAPVVLALLVRAALAARTTGGADERDAALTGAAVATAVAWLAGAAAASPGSVTAGDGSAATTIAPVVAAGTALGLVAALVGSRRWGTTATVVAAAAAAPVAALTVATTHAVTGVPVAAGAALLATALGALTPAVAALLRATSGGTARRAAEGSAAFVVTAGLVAAAGEGPSTAAVALLVVAVGAAAWALTPARRPAWWAALALASAAWWVLLTADDVTLVEPYTLPPALVVAAVGAWRVARRRTGAAVLLLAGLAGASVPTAVLPDRLDTGAWWLDRGLVTAVVGGVLVAAAHGLRERRPDAVQPLAGLGAVLVALGPLRRAVTAALAPDAVPHGPGLPDGTVLVEAWSGSSALLLAAACALVVAPRARALLDRTAPLALLAVAAVPSLLAAASEPATASAVVRSGAVGAAALVVALVGGATGRTWHAPGDAPGRTAPGAAGDHLGAARGAGFAGLGLLLAVGAVATGTVVVAAHRPGWGADRWLDAPALVGAAVALTTVALTARRGASVPPAWAAGGALGLVPTLLVRGSDPRVALWCLVAAALLALGLLVPPPGTAAPDRAAVTSRPGTLTARAVARLLPACALGVALAGPWAVALVHGAAPGPASPLRVELLAAGTWLVALRHATTWPQAPGPGHLLRPQGTALRALLVVVAALPLAAATDASALGTARGVLLLAVGAALAWRAGDRATPWLGIGTATLGTVALALRGGPEPADVPWVVLGLVTVTLGARQLLRDRTRGSWPTLGAPVALTLGAPLAALVLAPAGWRLTLLLALGVATVVAGAARRWQAPFLLGTAGVLATLVVVLSPYASAALAAVDGWVLLAVGGALVLGLGITYERRVQDAREAVRFVGEMR